MSLDFEAIPYSVTSMQRPAVTIFYGFCMHGKVSFAGKYVLLSLGSIIDPIMHQRPRPDGFK